MTTHQITIDTKTHYRANF